MSDDVAQEQGVDTVSVDPIETPAPAGSDVAADAAVVQQPADDGNGVDEEPSSADAVARALSDSGRLSYSDGVCPLVASGDEVLRDRESMMVGKVEVTTRQPERILTSPVECPTCLHQVESHQLTFEPGTMVRDCAIAITNRAHPVVKDVIAAHDAGDTERAKRAAKRHPLGERILEVLGLRSDEDEVPA